MDQGWISNLWENNRAKVYAPTTKGSDNKVEAFYEKINKAISTTNLKDITILKADLTAKVGSGLIQNLVSKFRLGARASPYTILSRK